MLILATKDEYRGPDYASPKRKSDLPYVIDPNTRERRYLGTVPSDPGLFRAAAAEVPTFYQKYGDLAPSDMVPTDHNISIPVMDQNGIGACTYYSTCLSMLAIYHLEGQPLPDLDPDAAYARACDGVDRGSSIVEAHGLMKSAGFPPRGFAPRHNYNPRRVDGRAWELAKKYRLRIGSVLESFRDMTVASILGVPFVFSLRASGAFNRLDAEGVPGYARGAGNHAVAGAGKYALKKNGDGKVWMQNSWTVAWGLKGGCWIDEKFIEGQAYLEIVSFEAVAEVEDDGSRPPVNPVS